MKYIWIDRSTMDEKGLADIYFKVNGEWEYVKRDKPENLYINKDRVLRSYLRDLSENCMKSRCEMENEEISDAQKEINYWRRKYLNSDIKFLNIKDDYDLTYKFFMVTPSERILKHGADKVLKDCITAALSEIEYQRERE